MELCLSQSLWYNEKNIVNHPKPERLCTLVNNAWRIHSKHVISPFNNNTYFSKKYIYLVDPLTSLVIINITFLICSMIINIKSNIVT